MKSLLNILCIISFSSFTMMSQTIEDALRYSSQVPTGTARSMALGNAMGALGGDYSGLSINPAGIAVYRSSEFTFTPSLRYSQTEADYYNNKTTDDKFSLPFQQIGFVGTYKPMHEIESGVISTHFGIGYTRNNSFSRRGYISANAVNSSLLDEYVANANAGMLNNFYNGLAYEHFLLEKVPSDEYMHAFEYLGDNEVDVEWGPKDGINQTRLINERGNSGEFSLSFGANFSHKLYFGASLGIATYFYEQQLSHHEYVNGGTDFLSDSYLFYRGIDELDGFNNFSFHEKIKTVGSGVNLKTGIIYKPVNSLRLGVAIHTPTFYSFDEEYTTKVETNAINISVDENDNIYLENGDNIRGTKYGEFSYNFRTPLKAIGSLSYIFGTFGLISVDYEYTDYSTMVFKGKYTNLDEVNSINSKNSLIKDTYLATHNFRFGAEIRPTEVLSLRAGYGLFQNPYKKDSFNEKDMQQTISAGFGYRMSNMFIDFAYVLHNRKDAYSLYYAGHIAEEDQLPAQIITNNHTLALTLGWRF